MVDESTAVLIALMGVGGTLVAGALGQLTLLRLDARRERLDRQRRTSQVLRSVRLVDEELAWNARVLRHAREVKAWWQPSQGPSLDAWHEHAPDLAGELDPGTWGELARAAMAVRVLLRIRSELDADPDAADIWQRVDAEADAADELIRDARILVRPMNLGGSTFGRQSGSTWLPAVPELGPWDLWPKRRWRRFKRRRARPSATPIHESDEIFEIVP